MMKKSRIFLLLIALLGILAYSFKSDLVVLLNKFKAIDCEDSAIEILMKKSKLKELNKLRLKSISDNEFSQAKVYFKAKAVQGKDTFKIRLKMKGDQKDHYDTDKFSFRISEGKKSDKEFGSKSIQHPKVRNYLKEWMLHKLLAYNDLPCISYDFEGVKINGEYKGVYAFEQHFSDAQLFNNWNGIPAPILGFRDDLFWSDAPPEGRSKDYSYSKFKESEIKIFTKSNPNIDSNLVVKSHDLLDAFRQGSSRADTIFDLEKMGKFFAVMDLVGGRHGLGWINVRYYFNPSTNLLEPLGFDSNGGFLQKVMLEEDYFIKKIYESVYAQSSFQDSYTRHQIEFSKKEYLDTFFSKHDTELDQARRKIHSSHPEYYFNQSLYYFNQDKIRKYLEAK